MGAVYQAEHTHMRKRLAVKVLHPEMSRLSEVVARFEREAMAAAHIDHPNVAAATDFGKLDDGSFFLVLEFVEGQSLRDAMNQGPLDVGRALRILRQVAGALGQAHALGIVHRDLKPENVMLVERNGDPDFVKVLDFGIAKVPVGELAKEAPGSVKGPVLTQLGMVYGTPEYMAPEQALGQNVDPRADIYALGVLTFEMLAGVRPFDHESKVTLLGMHVTAPVPPIAQKNPNVHVPPEVEAIVIRMLAKESTARYDDAKDLVDALDSVWQPTWGTLPGPASQMNPRASQLGLAPHSNPSLPNLGNAQTQVAIPSSSLEILGNQSLVQRVTSKVKNNPKPLIFGGLVVSAFLGVFLLKGAFDHTTHDVSTVDDAGNVVVTTVMDAQVVAPALDAQVAAAIAQVDQGNYGTAIPQLKDLETQAPDRADIHRALFRAYTATQNSADAINELKLLFAADPSTTKDPELITVVRNAALAPTTQDAALALMQSGMGSEGPDTLYNIGYVLPPGQYPVPAEKARKALQKSAVRALASPGLLVTLDARNANSCSAKKAILPQASSVGDNNTLAVLKTWTATKGCGFLSQRDCNPCIHKDGSLSNAIRDIEARVNK